MRNIFRFIIIVFVLNSFLVSAQNEAPKQVVIDGKTYILHPVKAGETLYSIGNRYGVESMTIINNNPQLVTGLKAGDELRIPVTQKEVPTVTKQPDRVPAGFLIHNVQRRETLYSISRKYEVTIDDILNYNPGIGQLRRGEKIRIPQWDKSASVQTSKTPQTTQGNVVIHEVAPGETLYGISRKYNVSMQHILSLNPEATNLKPGMKLKVQPVDYTPTAVIAKPEMKEEFIDHTIVSGETLFSLSRRYNVTAERLVELNPVLAGSFRTGTVVRIPVLTPAKETDSFQKHAVQKGETLEQISQQYRVTPGEMTSWNPFLSYRGVLPGDTLRYIPGQAELVETIVAEELPPASLTECDQMRLGKFQQKTVNVVMLLPMMSDGVNVSAPSSSQNRGSTGNDPEVNTSGATETNIRFQGNSENFVHFYEGALLAIDSLQEQGIKVNFQVFDTDQRDSRVQQLISGGRLKNADLIIGPVYPNIQREIAEYAVQNQIPMVSPLSPAEEITRSNPWFFQINPTREVINAITSDYVADNYKNGNFIVLQTGRNNNQDVELINMIKEKVDRQTNGRGRFVNCDFQKTGLAGLRSLVVKGQKNIILLTSGTEAEVSVGLSNIHTLAANHDITVIGNNRFTQFESINQEYFHDGQLEFLAPYWPDYTKPVTKSFVKKFRNYFRTEPNQYSMQGYDVTYFFTRAVAEYGSDFRHCVHTLKPVLVQGNYHFERLPQGGFINKGLNVVTFTRDYRVTTRPNGN